MDYHSSISDNTEQALSEDAAIPTSQVTPLGIAVDQASGAPLSLVPLAPATAPVTPRPPPGNYPWLPPFPTPDAPIAPLDVPSLMSVPVSTTQAPAAPRIAPPPPVSAPPPTATPSFRAKPRWTQHEKDTVGELMRNVISENVVHGVRKRWDVITQRLQGYNLSNPPRSAKALKKFWKKEGRAAYGVDGGLRGRDGEKADGTEDESTKAAKGRKRRLSTPPSPPPTKYRKHDKREDDDDGRDGDLQASRQPGLRYRSDIAAGRS